VSSRVVWVCTTGLNRTIIGLKGRSQLCNPLHHSTFESYRHNRSSNKRENRDAIIHIRESMSEIHKDFENLVDGHKNQKYTFFIDKLLEYIYPVFMRNPFSSAFEERRSYAVNK
jgi:hypothetical protein